MGFRILIITLAQLLFSSFAFGAENINAKMARLDFGRSTIEDVIRIFGRPYSYTWDNKTFKKNNLPDRYIADFQQGNIRIMMLQKTVYEVRFEKKDIGFRYLNKIGLSSSLEEAIDAIGPPKQVVIGIAMPKTAQDGVLYKDIEGKIGKAYYCRQDKGIRCFFAGNKISGLYITANTPYVPPPPAKK
jgi:hypothetical protein